MHRTVLLAHQVNALLDGLVWAIGGSVLLYRLGIESEPNDLDIVTTKRDFKSVCRRLEARYGPSVRPPDTFELSSHFARFDRHPLCSIDLMAGIARQTNATPKSFTLDRRKIEVIDNLPWMTAGDWIEIYSIFDRPQRLRQLQEYFQRNAEKRSRNGMLSKARILSKTRGTA
jgi:hypothetical protein